MIKDLSILINDFKLSDKNMVDELLEINIIKEKEKKREEFTKYANKFAIEILSSADIKKLIIENKNKNFNNFSYFHEIRIDCTNKRIGMIDNKPVYPNKFLDPTFINGTKYRTTSHQIFKKQFFEILNTIFTENHNMHIRFDKDPINNKIFYIRFFNRRENNEWIVHKQKIY